MKALMIGLADGQMIRNKDLLISSGSLACDYVGSRGFISVDASTTPHNIYSRFS